MNGKLLKDEKTMLADGDFIRGCQLSMRFRHIKILFVDEAWPKNKYIKIFVKTSLTVLKLKQRIQKLTGIPDIQQKLTFKEKPLQDFKTMNYYRIKTNDIIILSLACQ